VSKNDSQESKDRFTLLYHLAQTFNSSLDLDEVLDLVIDEVIAAIGAERGFIALREPDGELVFCSARGIDQTAIDHPEFQISRGVVEEVARHGDAVLTSDAQQDDRFSARRSVTDLGLRSIICTPVKLKEKHLGVIYVDNRLQAGIFTDQDLDLLSAIASSAAIAIENARLYEVSIEKGRMERELQMAYRVQSSLIPESTPQIPGWEFAAFWQPARVVAGDFYDFIQVEDSKLGIVIADVTDKGMSAALFMALTRSIVRACLDQLSSPSEAITRANRLICTDSTINMPVTLFYCLLDPSQGEIIYVNGGHNPPLHYQSKADHFIELTITGMFLGFECDVIYEQRSQKINSGDFIVFYTDGVTDAINKDQAMFGKERFLSVIKEKRYSSALDILAAVTQSIQEFSGSIAPYDDITLLIAKRS